MLVAGLDVHLTPGRAQKGLCEFLSAVRAVRRRFAESLGERVGVECRRSHEPGIRKIYRTSNRDLLLLLYCNCILPSHENR